MPYYASFEYRDRVTGELVTINDLYYESDDQKAIIEELSRAFQLVSEITLVPVQLYRVP